jgi:hypothetical protein
MQAHATPPSGPGPTWQRRSPGRHERASPPPEQDFDYGRPFLVDIGRAAVIAEALRQRGYPRCTADVVAAELAMPHRDRSVIGRFATDQLARARWRP